MRGLSVLELYMLVAVVRLQRRGAGGGASFECAFAEYSALQRLHRTSDAYGRAAALRAFERLLGAALLEHPGGRCVTIGFPVGFETLSVWQAPPCCGPSSGCWALRCWSTRAAGV